MTMVSVL